MEIYLVRHTSVNVPAGYAYGQTDVPLRPTFREGSRSRKKDLNPAIHSTRCGVARLHAAPPRRLLWLPGRQKRKTASKKSVSENGK